MLYKRGGGIRCLAFPVQRVPVQVAMEGRQAGVGQVTGRCREGSLVSRTGEVHIFKP